MYGGSATPYELKRAADCVGKVAVATEVTHLVTPSSTQTGPRAAPVLHTRLGAGIRMEQAELTPGLAATLRHAASMHNPLFYERQRMRASTYNIPRFLHSYDETLDGGLILPRGMLGTVTDLAAQAGSRLDITDERTPGTAQKFTFTANLTPPPVHRRHRTGQARSRDARLPARVGQDGDRLRGHRADARRVRVAARQGVRASLGWLAPPDQG
jgi:hypothetical protein